MKLSEVIKELEKDGTKIFVSKSQLTESENVKLYTSQGRFLHFNKDIGGIRIGCINLDREWEEIKQPITFDEVVNKVGLFKCKHPKIKEDGYWTLSRFIQMLYRECFDSAEIIDILKNGEFYN